MRSQRTTKKTIHNTGIANVEAAHARLSDFEGSVSNGVSRSLDHVRKANAVDAIARKRMERPMRIELTPEPWQGSVLPLY